MKNKLLSLLVAIVFISTSVQANEIQKHVKKMNFGIGSKVGIYVIDKNNTDIIYKKNEDKLLNPASVLKVLTFGASYNTLGKGYKFETSLYKHNNDIYLKLGGDVLLSQKDLNELISSLKNIQFNNIYIDDSIFDKEEYPATWLEEDKWPNQRQITPYIIDNNFVKVSINRSSLAKKVDIVQNDEYKIPFINELQIGDKHDIQILRIHDQETGIINLQGSVAYDDSITLPVVLPEVNFIVKLNKSIKKNDIVYNNVVKVKKTPKDAVKIASVGHEITEISKLILHNSDNFAAEVVSKVAASAFLNYEKSSSFADVATMFNSFYSPYISLNDVICDASGVSRGNFLSTKTISNILLKLFSNPDYIGLLPTANQGTLSDRLLFLEGNLRAKTGTMREHSSLAGILKTRNENSIVFVSIIQNSSKRKSLLKNFENTLVGEIYKKY